jgi:hypothetical protein
VSEANKVRADDGAIKTCPLALNTQDTVAEVEREVVADMFGDRLEDLDA